MKKVWISLTIFLILLAGCSSMDLLKTVPTTDANLIYTQAAATVQSQITEVFLLTPSATATMTPEPTATETPTPLPTAIPTEPWAVVPAGSIDAPILLYTHITDDKDDNPYYQNDSTLDIPSDVFRKQMTAFKNAGYETITVSKLIETIYSGGELPPKPLLITFDGSTTGIFNKAYPILEELGFIANVYLLAGRMDGGGVITVEQAKELADAGWEIGAKGMYGGINLVNDFGKTGQEAGLSKSTLEENLGIPINTFSYPFGAMDEQVAGKVIQYGYRGAVGLGKSVEHGLNSIFYLSRLEITTETTLEELNALIPWEIESSEETPTEESTSETQAGTEPEQTVTP